MLLGIREIRRDAGQGSHVRRVIDLRCDVCGIEYESKYSKSVLEKKRHYHNKECAHVARKKGGDIHAVFVETSQRLYGTDNPAQSRVVKDKIADTTMQHLGVRCSFQAESVKEKSRQTNVRVRGVEHHMHCPDVVQTLVESNLRNHGVENVFQLESVKKKSRKTNMKNRGVEYAMQCPDVQALTVERNLQKYGVENVMQHPDVKKKQIQTLEDRHGVTNSFLTPKARANMRSPEAQARRMMSLVANGNHKKSDEEDDVIATLQAVGLKLTRWPMLTRWSMDAVTLDGNAYIQSDGIFYHGLDRPMSVIEERRCVIDEAIIEKYKRDRAQEAWFASDETNPDGKKLVRIVTGGVKVADERYFLDQPKNVLRIRWPCDINEILGFFSS